MNEKKQPQSLCTVVAELGPHLLLVLFTYFIFLFCFHTTSTHWNLNRSDDQVRPSCTCSVFSCTSSSSSDGGLLWRRKGKTFANETKPTTVVGNNNQNKRVQLLLAFFENYLDQTYRAFHGLWFIVFVCSWTDLYWNNSAEKNWFCRILQ